MTLSRTTLLSLVIILTFPALASGAEDMFSDRTRPAVEGDRDISRRDMFQGSDYYRRSDADLFSRNYTYMPTEMDLFGQKPPANNFGANDMFNPRPIPVPDQRLYKWPNGQNR